MEKKIGNRLYRGLLKRVAKAWTRQQIRGVRLSPLPLKANKTCTTIELSMVPDLLIGNFKTQCFDVELLCPFQIFEVELNTDESCLNPLCKILSGFEYSAAAASEKPYRRERAERSW